VDLIQAEAFFKTVVKQGYAMGEFNFGNALSQHASSGSHLASMSEYFKRAAGESLALGRSITQFFF
jgi:hypothetical protein